jgi:hypothetical protein
LLPPAASRPSLTRRLPPPLIIPRPQEVEAALSAQPGVAQAAAAIVRHPATGQDHLAAWVSPAGVDARALLAGVQGSLPPYMVPTVLVPMPALPLLASEKVNRKALPEPDWALHAVAAPGAVAAARPAAAAAAVPEEADPLDVLIRGVWAELLGQPAAELGPDADFFEAGGNSLLCGVCSSRVRATLGLPGMSGLLIFQHPTLAGYAAAVRAAAAEAGVPRGDSVASLALTGGDALKAGKHGIADDDRVLIIAGLDSGSGSGSGSSLGSRRASDAGSFDGFEAAAKASAAVAAAAAAAPVKKAGSKAAAAPPAAPRASLAWATALQVGGAACGMSVQFLLTLLPLLIFDATFTVVGWPALALLPALDFVLLVVHALVAIGAKWLLVGRYTEGEHPIYGWFYVRHWLANLLSIVRRGVEERG